jgi:hypothetical protein
MTEEVIPDVSSGSLNLATCIAEADGEIDEAGRAGDYEVPFDPAPQRIGDLSAVGALARARRALQLGNQAAEEPDPYWREFEAGLEMLRKGGLDLGTVVVSGEAVAMPSEEGDWAQLAHRGLLMGSVQVTNEGGTFTYVEDREEYEPGYRASSVKDYRVDHRGGRVAWLLGGRIGPGQMVTAGYEYYRRQPGRAEEAEYGRRTASAGEVRRADQQE